MKGEGGTSRLEKATDDRFYHLENSRKRRQSAREHEQYESLGLGVGPAGYPKCGTLEHRMYSWITR